jgi:hypothetical protein
MVTTTAGFIPARGQILQITSSRLILVRLSCLVPRRHFEIGSFGLLILMGSKDHSLCLSDRGYLYSITVWILNERNIRKYPWNMENMAIYCLAHPRIPIRKWTIQMVDKNYSNKLKLK